MAARGPGTGAIPLPLEAYEAAVLVAYDADHPPASWLVQSGFVSLALDGPWTVRLPRRRRRRLRSSLPHRWEDNEALRSYAGTALYATAFTLDEVPAAAELDLGPAVPVPAGGAEEAGLRGRSFRAAVVPPIGEVAEVVVNGTSAGVVWGTPYRLDVGPHLRGGANSSSSASRTPPPGRSPPIPRSRRGPSRARSCSAAASGCRTSTSPPPG